MRVTFDTIEVSDPDLEVDGVRFVTVRSAALGGRTDLTLWVPPGVEGPLPLVVLLHGVYGSHWLWTAKAGVHHTAARLLAAGEIPPMVIAMPNDGLWKDGSGYLRVDDRDVATFIVDEVPAAAAEAAPVVDPASGMCLGGLSMGGFGALRLGATNPATYRALAGLSSITSFEDLTRFTETPLEAYGNGRDDWDVGELLAAGADRLPPLLLVCGTEDELLPSNRELHHRLTEAGVRHEYAEHPGGHEWPFWSRHVEDALRFFGRQLDAPRRR